MKQYLGAICRINNYSKETVSLLMKNYGFDDFTDNEQQVVSKQQLELIQQNREWLYANSFPYTVDEISNLLGLSFELIRHFLINNGYKRSEIKGDSRVLNSLYDTIREQRSELKQLKTYEELCMKTGLKFSTIRDFLISKDYHLGKIGLKDIVPNDAFQVAIQHKEELKDKELHTIRYSILDMSHNLNVSMTSIAMLSNRINRPFNIKFPYQFSNEDSSILWGYRDRLINFDKEYCNLISQRVKRSQLNLTIDQECRFLDFVANLYSSKDFAELEASVRFGDKESNYTVSIEDIFLFNECYENSTFKIHPEEEEPSNIQSEKEFEEGDQSHIIRNPNSRLKVSRDDNLYDSIKHGRICPYCRCKTKENQDYLFFVFDDGDMISGSVQECPQCHAYVTQDKYGIPKGMVANASLRLKRQELHDAFDRLWNPNVKDSRDAAYRYLSSKMGIPFEYTHIAMFDDDEIDRAMEIANAKFVQDQDQDMKALRKKLNHNKMFL